MKKSGARAARPSESGPGRGLLVVVEGIDGSGKSTLVARLAEHCAKQGLECVVSREPTNGKWGSLLRQSARGSRLRLAEELELFMKDRAEHVEQIISPALAAGKVVILDRYYFSTAAYQGARGGDPEAILEANERFAPVPDLVLLLDVSPRVGSGRITHRGDQVDAFEEADYQEDVRRMYLRLDRRCIRLIDAGRPPEEVWHDCLAQFTATLARRGMPDATN
jgi:dTMP kinase